MTLPAARRAGGRYRSTAGERRSVHRYLQPLVRERGCPGHTSWTDRRTPYCYIDEFTAGSGQWAISVTALGQNGRNVRWPRPGIAN